MKYFYIAYAIFILNNDSFSQSKISVNEVCSYYGEKTPGSVYVFSSDDEASSALQLITNASGLALNFKIMAANVPNAAAIIINNDRYILYNQTFMHNISNRINYWASISILAHEVGHHLNGHSLKPGGSRPELEIQADKFSGFILSKLGATLEESQSAINVLVSEIGSATHPGKTARLAAIANGWYQNKSSQNQSTSSSGINIRPVSLEQLSYKKIQNNINGGFYFQISSNGYIFSPSEYKIINIELDGNECFKKNPKAFIVYMKAYEKYFYTHNIYLDPESIDINLKTIFNESNPYMYIGGKCFSRAYYKGEILIKEERIPADIKYTPSGFTSSLLDINMRFFKHTYSNGIDLYLQPYGPGLKGLMIPEPGFLSPPIVKINPYNY